MDIVALLTAIGGLGIPAFIIQLIRGWWPASSRARLLQDIEIMKALPVNGTARRLLEKKIEDQARELVADQEKRRDWFGVTLAAFFLTAGVLSVVLIFSERGWWLFLSPVAGFLLLFGVVGLALDIPRKFRDERGRAIPDPQKRK